MRCANKIQSHAIAIPSVTAGRRRIALGNPIYVKSTIIDSIAFAVLSFQWCLAVDALTAFAMRPRCMQIADYAGELA
jgi:hypothetical protein